jgi:uncharacterized 2Fe-2S/4Fe-4S cluster protein (DUF4445 family)
MDPDCSLRLLPLGERIDVARGTPLQDVLFLHGVEFPCGGHGRCRGCRVRVLEGELAVTPAMRRKLSDAELAAGWRLSCCASVEGPLALEVAQWTTPGLVTNLADTLEVPFEPGEGLGVAVDLGTTTLAAQLLDLSTGEVLAVELALNPQCIHGADVMSRVEFALHGGAGQLTSLVRQSIGGMIARMLASAGRAAEVRRVELVGNTVMHHLFCAIDVAPLSHAPFEPVDDDLQRLTAAGLAWTLPGNPAIEFLPCLGGFVGSDILAGAIALDLFDAREPAALLDLGTNGEIVLAAGGAMACASTAAGPAFEAARIRMGMRAAAGAIARVEVAEGEMRCHVLGGGAPRGICGSGLVDAVAAALSLGRIQPDGRIAGGARELAIESPVVLTQRDVRELQLAKAAIAAGVQLLSRETGLDPRDLATVHLAGAFGNYLDPASAVRIGLLPVDPACIVSGGNTALRGARLLLLCPSRKAALIEEARTRIRHIALAASPDFQDVFTDCLGFPEA